MVVPLRASAQRWSGAGERALRCAHPRAEVAFPPSAIKSEKNWVLPTTVGSRWETRSKWRKLTDARGNGLGQGLEHSWERFDASGQKLSIRTVASPPTLPLVSYIQGGLPSASCLGDHIVYCSNPLALVRAPCEALLYLSAMLIACKHNAGNGAEQSSLAMGKS